MFEKTWRSQKVCKLYAGSEKEDKAGTLQLKKETIEVHSYHLDENDQYLTNLRIQKQKHF